MDFTHRRWNQFDSDSLLILHFSKLASRPTIADRDGLQDIPSLRPFSTSLTIAIAFRYLCKSLHFDPNHKSTMPYHVPKKNGTANFDGICCQIVKNDLSVTCGEKIAISPLHMILARSFCTVLILLQTRYVDNFFARITSFSMERNVTHIPKRCYRAFLLIDTRKWSVKQSTYLTRFYFYFSKYPTI